VNQNYNAILLVAFGTTVPSAAEAFSCFESSVRTRFPETEIRWAYTSSIVRKKLADKGDQKQSVEEALEGLAYDGYRSIAVQSLHTIAGLEYHKLLRDFSVFRRKVVAQNLLLTIGNPLLFNYDDVCRVAAAMVAFAPAQRESSEALIYMGHGSEKHPSDLAYVALAALLNELDNHAWLCTVEGHPTIEDVALRCKAFGIKKAWLIPFMAIAGDHAINDMVGDDKESLKSILASHGISSEPVFKGTLENKLIRDIWLDHLQLAIERGFRSSKENCPEYGL
jgi:sirohydrochlorin cobaltochelatase